MVALTSRLRHVRAARVLHDGSSARTLTTNSPGSRQLPPRRNWLEDNCGDVPRSPHPRNAEVSSMLRGGHALQVANAAMLDAKLTASTARRAGPVLSEAHTQTLQELKAQEERGIARLARAIDTTGARFRPSLLVPVVRASSLALGAFLGAFGEKVSTSYVAGVNSAIADYYNDQIREIYARHPDQTELKELFKSARDEELVFVEMYAPEALDPAHEESDRVRQFARNSTKALVQFAKRV